MGELRRVICIDCEDFQGDEPENIEAAAIMAKGIYLAMNLEAQKAARDLEKGNPETPGDVLAAIKRYRVKVIKVQL